MASKREVKVYITGDASGFKKAAESANASGMSIGSTLKKIGVGIGIAQLGRGIMSATKDFEDLALGAKNFATASGLGVEQASRWREVFGDLGIDADAGQAAFAKLEKTLGTNADKWKALGFTVKKTADGQVDANATMLAALQTLADTKDPLARAKLGSELFGRAWTQLAPLVEKGAAGVADALASVGDAQVINDDEVKKAERFRDTMDNFHDKIDGVKFAFAAGLMPVISTFAETIGNLDPKLVALIGTVGVGVIVLGKLGDAGRGVAGVLTLIQSHPLVAGAGLVLTGIALLIANWDKVTAAVEKALGAMKKVGEVVTSPIKGIIDPITKGIRNIIDGDSAGSKRWTGGHINGTGPVLTGERGPELFWPGGAGRMSNTRETSGMMGGRGGMVNHWNVNVRDDSDIRKIDRRLARYQARLDQGRGRPTVVPATR